MTLVSIPLMEKSGRRFLHLLGLGGMFVFSILMTIAFVLQNRYDWLKYLSIVSMMLYIVFFAIGPGSIPWLIVAELFSQGPRSAAVSLAVLVNWSANVAVGQGFPPLFQVILNFCLLNCLVLVLMRFIYFRMWPSNGLFCCSPCSWRFFGCLRSCFCPRLKIKKSRMWPTTLKIMSSRSSQNSAVTHLLNPLIIKNKFILTVRIY